MNKIKIVSKMLLAVLLCAALLCQTIFAANTEEKQQYVKDIKLIYADNESQAEKQLPDGYYLVPGNLNVDTNREGVFACFSITEDPNQAITDIKVMHESGGFERTDFRSSLDDAIDGVYSLAQEMTTAVEEFVENYKAGVPGAVYAKEALDYFEYEKGVRLGDYMVSQKGTYKEYGQMILMCHEDILNPILSLLALGVQKKQGENWIDKLENIDPSAYDESHDMKYRERASKLRPILQQFNDIYCYVLGYYDETYTYSDLTEDNDKELFSQMAENKDMFLVIQSILQGYFVGVDSSWGEWGGTAEDLFAIGLNNPLNIHESYALLDCLTPGQEIMLRLVGPYNFIIGAQNDEEILQQAREQITSELDKDDVVPIWEGVNLEMFEQEVGLTNDAQRSIAAGKQYDIFTKDIDKLKTHYRNVAAIVSSAVSIATSAVLVVKCGLPLVSWGLAKVSLVSASAAVSAFASSALVTSILLYSGLTFLVVGVICAIIVTFFLEDIINWIVGERYDRTTIPAYMVDETVNKEGVSTYTYYKRVDNVKSDKELGLDTGDNESGSDINANKGYRWMALYTSDKSSLGNPIKADFKVVEKSGTTPDGYVNLSLFGRNDSMNLNSYADKQSSKYTPVYLFYKQDASEKISSEKLYISDIRVESGSHEDVIRKELNNSGYIVFDHDFSIEKGTSIYIGYKLTANADDAVRDIRLLYNFSGTGITYGQLNFGSMGKIGNFDLMVSSTNANPAPPVVKLAVFKRGEEPDASLGYEPVNEFSGGMAVPLGNSEYRLYFLPETTYTEGEDYLAGIKTDVYYFNTHTEQIGHEYIMNYYYANDRYSNSYDKYKEFKTKEYGEQFFDYNTKMSYAYGVQSNFATAGNSLVLGYKYTTTKNPYRAMYGIAANKLSGLNAFDSSVSYGGTGYVLSAVEYSTNSCSAHENFIYMPHKHKSEFCEVWRSRALNNTAYISENSPGKADSYFDGKAYDLGKQGIHSRYDIRNQDITQVFLGDDMRALYISGYQADKTPLKVEDIIISKDKLSEKEIPENFIGVYSMIGTDSEPINVAPSTNETEIGSKYIYGGMKTKKIKARLYDEAYMYFRNEKTVNGKAEAQQSPKQGKYISAVYITSREEIREASLQNNKDLKCKDISKSVVESNLLGAGATITYRSHINTNFSKDDEFTNANYTYVGISRTDKKTEAITDIRLLVAKKGESPKRSYKRKITYNDMSFEVTYNLVSKASLTEQGNKSDKNCAKERQVYVYTSTHPALGEPITDIKMSNWYSFEDFEPVFTMDNKHFINAYKQNKKDKGASIFVDDDYFEHGNHLSFRREGGEAPYVKEIMVAADDDSTKNAVAKLLEKGYTDIIKTDINADAGGDYIHIGMKRTANKKEAIYDVMLTSNKKKPADTVKGYSLVSKVDLNKDAGGKYIYLYEKRTPDSIGRSPLYDLWVKGKSFKDTVDTKGDITYYETRAVDQDNKVLDLNKGAGGDYIYLVKIYNVQSGIVGSLIGSGSVWVILMFVLAAAAACGYYIFLKKRNQEQNSSEKEENLKK